MNTLGVTVTLEVLPLVSVTVTPPGGAGTVSVTGKDTALLGLTLMPAGKLMAPEPAGMLVRAKVVVSPAAVAVTT